VNTDLSAYAQRIAALHVELGIPPDYATRRGLPLQKEVTPLVCICTGIDKRELTLTPPAAMAWERVQRAAATDGIYCRRCRVFAASHGKPKSSGQNSRAAKALPPSCQSMPRPATANITRVARSISARRANRPLKKVSPARTHFAGCRRMHHASASIFLIRAAIRTVSTSSLGTGAGSRNTKRQAASPLSFDFSCRRQAKWPWAKNNFWE
jgi:hypothetical protein